MRVLTKEFWTEVWNDTFIGYDFTPDQSQRKGKPIWIPPTHDYTTFNVDNDNKRTAYWKGTDGWVYIANLQEDDEIGVYLRVTQENASYQTVMEWKLPPDTSVLQILANGYEDVVWNEDEKEWGDRVDNGSLEIGAPYI